MVRNAILCITFFLHSIQASSIRGDGSLEIQRYLVAPYVISWDVLGEITAQGTPLHVTALVNRLHNSSNDVTLLAEHSTGAMTLRNGWVSERSMQHKGDGVSLLRAHVELFLCPHSYQVHAEAARAASPSETLSSAGCVRAAEHHFHILELHFSVKSRPITIHMPLPFTGAREQILAALPSGLSLPAINRALDYVRSVAFAFIERAVVPDDALVMDWFEGDDELQDAMRALCAETMPEPEGLEAAMNTQAQFTKGDPTYAHKLGALLVAISTFQLELCVETGSLYGETAFHLAAACDTVFTVELSSKLAERLRRALPVAQSKYKRNMTLLEGNSGQLLRDSRIQNDPRAALFWLDGHFSAGVTAHLDPSAHRHFGAPVLEELRAVFARKNEGDVIVIDDTKAFFHPSSGYPSIREITGLVCQEAPSWRVQVREEGIRIFKRRAPPALPNACAHFGGYREDLARDHGQDMCQIGGWTEDDFAGDALLDPPDV